MSAKHRVELAETLSTGDLAGLPAHWEMLPIEQLTGGSRGDFIDGDWVEAEWITDAGIRLIQTGNIGMGTYLDKPHNAKYIAESSFAKLGCKWVRAGDVLICRLADPVGRACIVPASLDMSITSVDCAILRPDPSRMDRRFVLHYLGTLEYLRRAAEAASGTTRTRISRSNLGRIPVPAPPLPEQRAIARVLDTADQAIEKTERLIQHLQQAKIGMLHDLLTLGLDAQGQLRDPAAHPEQFQVTELGRLPKQWDVQSLGQITTDYGGVLQTGPFGSQLHAHEYSVEGVPVVMPQDIIDGVVDERNVARIPASRAQSLGRHRAKVGDVLFSRRGDLSRAAAIGEREVGWICGTGCLLARTNPRVLRGAWLALQYRTQAVQSQVMAMAVGSTMANLNANILGKLVVAMPSEAEQQVILDRVVALDELIDAEERALRESQRLKAGLMDDLLTGRVRVPEAATA